MTSRLLASAFAALASAGGTACVVEAPAPGAAVTLAVVDARVWTGDPERPLVEAIAVAGDRIAAVGSTVAIRILAGTAPVIEGRGRMVTPGFIDAHLRLMEPPRGVEGPPSPASAAQKDRILDEAIAVLAPRGVTTVHHIGGLDDLEVLARAAVAGRLTARVYAAVPLVDRERLLAGMAAELYGGSETRSDVWLRVGAVTVHLDGPLRSHTAALLGSYEDDPTEVGSLRVDPTRTAEAMTQADRAGLQLMVHAVGDRANRWALDMLEEITRENGPRDRRFRVEHAEHLQSDDIARFAQLGAIASVQPADLTETGRWADAIVGPVRARGAFALRSLLDARARVVFGSDGIAISSTPLEAMYAAVTRRPLDGSRRAGWVPEQKITIAEALDAFTRGGAYAAFEEERKGRLAVGYLADFVLLEDDLFSVPSPDIRRVPVLLTVVGGEIIYDGRSTADDATF